jgi:hypothetical protein
MLITHALAQRLETAEAADGEGCAEAEWIFTPHSKAAVTSVAGGFVMFLGAESPLSHALGVGMHGPVTRADLEQIEHFYHSREAPVTIDLCPYADPTFQELLGERGYRLSQFTNVMVRALQPGEVIPDGPPGEQIMTRAATPLDIEAWADTVVRGFFGRDELTSAEIHLGRLLFSLPACTPYLAECGEDPVGGGGMSIRRGVASFFADAVLTSYRRRGAHAGLIRARLRDAIAAGCDLATAGTQPGTTSQLNYQRLGFEIAYTKATMVLD